MSKEIYNEGRVVGYSAYEIYLKNHLLKYPNIAPASENQWLTANIGTGASMILKVNSLMKAGTLTYPGDDSKILYAYRATLPRSSVLASSNTLIASYFAGECAFDSNGWATKVVDYGGFISNTSTLPPDANHPGAVTSSSSVKIAESGVSSYGITKRLELMNYMKIVDGGVIQVGEWVQTPSGSPFKDFLPRFDQWGATDAVSIVIITDGELTEDVPILITGFQDNFIISGESSGGGSTATGHPQDGDFLGPACIPWASKIIFNVPTEYRNMKINYLEGFAIPPYRFLGYATSESGSFSQDGQQVAIINDVEFDPTNASGYLNLHDVIRDPDGNYWEAQNGTSVGTYKWSAVNRSAIFSDYAMDQSDTFFDAHEGSRFYNTLLYNQTQGDDESLPYMRWKNYENISIDRSVGNVSDLTHDHSNILQLHSKNDIDPPVLYFSEASQTDSSLYLNPVDIMSPGTVKVLRSTDTSESTRKTKFEDLMISQEASYPGTVQLLLSTPANSMLGGPPYVEGVGLLALNGNNELTPIVDVSAQDIEYGLDETVDGVLVTRSDRYTYGLEYRLAQKHHTTAGPYKMNALSLDRTVSSFDDDSNAYVKYLRSSVGAPKPWYQMFNTDSIMADDYTIVHSSKIGARIWQGSLQISDDDVAYEWLINDNENYIGLADSSWNPEGADLRNPVVKLRSKGPGLPTESVEAQDGDWVRRAPNAQFIYIWNRMNTVWEKTKVQQYLDGSDSHNIGSDNITWSKLFDALVSDGVVDILGDNLKQFKYNLPNLFAMNAYPDTDVPSTATYDSSQGKMTTLDIKGYDRIFVNKVPFLMRSDDDIPRLTKNSTNEPYPGIGIYTTTMQGSNTLTYLQMNGIRVYFSTSKITGADVADPDVTIFGLGKIDGSTDGLYVLNGSTWNKLA